VVGSLAVQVLVVAAVVGQHGTAEGASAGQDVRVRCRRPSVVLSREYVMAETPQFVPRGPGKSSSA